MIKPLNYYYMEQKNNLNEENKKRAAFKRFSQMSAAGLAVISLSAFTDVSAQPLSAKVENDTVKEPNLSSVNISTSDSLSHDEIRWLDANYYDNYSNNYCNYSNYSNYSNNNNNYTNNYSNNYTNNYSNNYSDIID
jgi:hypothetical protein